MEKSTLSGGNQVEKGKKASPTVRLFSSYYISKDLRARSRKLFNQSAQAMVEFALTLPIILVMIFGIIEGGRLIYIYSSLAAAGREAARYGAGIGTLGNLGTGTILYNDCAGIRDAAKRIGRFAGVTDAGIHIYHDTGLDPLQVTEYCTLSKPSYTFIKGDRIIITINLSYASIVPLLPIPHLTLHTESAHTILMGAAVIAITPTPNEGAGQVCDVIPYTIAVLYPLGPVNDVTISKDIGTAPSIKNILLVWDGTGGPVLQSISAISPVLVSPLNGSGVGPLNDIGPFYKNDVMWIFPTATSPSTFTFKITFSKVLKSNVIIRLTLDDANHCSFGK